MYCITMYILPIITYIRGGGGGGGGGIFQGCFTTHHLSRVAERARNK